MPKIIICVLATIVYLSVLTFGSDYYVQPGEQISNILENLVPGDTVFFHGGVYHLSIQPPSGEPGKQITFKAFPKEKPILDGSEKLSGWKVYDKLNDIYYSEFDWGKDRYGAQLFPMMIFNNDSAMIRAQYPNQTNSYDPWDVEKYFVQENGGELWLQEKDLSRNLNYIGANVSVYNWATIRDNGIKVTGYDSINNIIRVSGSYSDKTPVNFKPAETWSTNSERSQYGLYFFSFWNKLEFLDSPGEFFVDTTAMPHRIYVKPYKKGDTANICGAKLVNAFDLSLKNAANYITIEGFTIRYYGISDYRSQGIICMIDRNNPQKGIIIRNNTIYNNVGAGVRFQGIPEDILIENNNIFHDGIITTEGYGICGAGDRFNVINNRIHDVVMDGLYLTGTLTNSTISGNIVYNCNSKFTHADGVKIDALRTTQDSNYVFTRNTIHDCGQTLYFGNGHKNVIIANNLIYNPEADCIRFAGRDQDGMRSENIYILNNTLIDSKIDDTENNHGICLEAVSNYKIINNIIDGGQGDWPLDERISNLYVGLTWTQNEQKGWTLADAEKICLNFNTLFLNADTNFRLNGSNVATRSGENLGNFDTLFNFAGRSLTNSTNIKLTSDDTNDSLLLAKLGINVDLDGKPRPAGKWSIGAFECESCHEVGVNPSPNHKKPKKLNFSINGVKTSNPFLSIEYENCRIAQIDIFNAAGKVLAHFPQDRFSAHNGEVNTTRVSLANRLSSGVHFLMVETLDNERYARQYTKFFVCK